MVNKYGLAVDTKDILYCITLEIPVLMYYSGYLLTCKGRGGEK